MKHEIAAGVSINNVCHHCDEPLLTREGPEVFTRVEGWYCVGSLY
jgi:hypothetical protein